MNKYEPWPKQTVFHDIGRSTKHRLLAHGTQCGSTTACAFETACHRIGWYPSWWHGKRFAAKANVMICAPAFEHIHYLMLPVLQHFVGSPPHGFYQRAFDNTDVLKGQFDVIWMEDEPDKETHDMLLRHLSPGGISIMNACPLKGVTETLRPYLEAHDYGRWDHVTLGITDIPGAEEEIAKRKRSLDQIPDETERRARLHGRSTVYVEPFAGSVASLLARPIK